MISSRFSDPRRWVPLSLAVMTFTLSGCAVADRSSTTGTSLRGKSSEEVLALALKDAEAALDGGLDSAEEKTAYANAVELIVSNRAKAPGGGGGADPIQQVPGYQLKLVLPKHISYDELVLARTVRSKHMDRRVTRDGVGAPYIAHLKYTEGIGKQERFMSKGGYFWPLTATIDFPQGSGKVQDARLIFHEVRVEDSVKLEGETYPLAADFTAVGEYVLSQKEGAMPRIAALLRSEKFMDDLQLIAFEPVDKDRIPLVMVHGLVSNPATWHQLYNELQDNPVIREKYQILFFRYPSGVPVLYSAERFRNALGELADQMDRMGGRANCDRTVLVGHSMGGLVSKMQVQTSGDILWKGLFGKSKDELNLPRDQKDTLSPYLDFQPNRRVDRVIFVAVPHRGSQMADGLPGYIGRRLISLPVNALGGAVGILFSDKVADIVQLEMKRVPNSIDNLSPESPFVKNSNAMPIRRGLKYHTVSGNKKNLPLDNPKAGDGVVPYSSSHLDGAVSEKVVPGSGHGVHETAEGQKEIERILLLHLKEW